MYGDEWRAEHKDWAVCEKDGDCIMADTVCGMPQAINKKFLKEYSAWLEKEYANSEVNCESISKAYFNATCEAGGCLARSKAGSSDRIRYLTSADIQSLPKNIAKELSARGCLIPAASPDARKSIAYGAFAMEGQKDVAVLCSKGGVSHVEIVWGGAKSCGNPGRSIPDSAFFGGQSFSREVRVRKSGKKGKKSGPVHDPCSARLGFLNHDVLSEFTDVETLYYCDGERWKSVECGDV